MEIEVYVMEPENIEKNRSMGSDAYPERRLVTLTLDSSTIIGYYHDVKEGEINIFITVDSFVAPYSIGLMDFLEKKGKQWQ